MYEQVGIDLGGAYTVWQYTSPARSAPREPNPATWSSSTTTRDNFIGHVGIYAGNGMMWHAPAPVAWCPLERVYTDKVYYGRVLNQ